jgi:hypothetical protein
MNALWNGLFGVATLIVGLALVATLVSRSANTSGVLQAASGGLATDIRAATEPVTGASGFSGFGGGLTLMGAPLG